MTIKEKYKVTLDFWDWARKQKGDYIGKIDWPGCYKLGELREYCSFCDEYQAECNVCPLGKKLGKCCDSDSAYDMWVEVDAKEQYKHAKKIYKFIKKYYNDRFNGSKNDG